MAIFKRGRDTLGFLMCDEFCFALKLGCFDIKAIYICLRVGGLAGGCIRHSSTHTYGAA